MQLTVYHTFEELEPLAEEWNDLLACCSASHVPFLRFEYLKTWWNTLGGGEWENGDLFTIVARSDDNLLTGIAPLFFTHNREQEPALMLLGSIEISDYLDLIVRQSELAAFCEALFEFLNSNQAPPWKVLDLYNIPESSPTLAALQNAAQGCGWKYGQETLQPCPVITLPGDWETYLAGIDKKQRHEVRRKMRRAEESEVPVRWYLVDKDHPVDGAGLDAEIEAFLALMAHDPDKERFLTSRMRQQMHDSIHAAYKAGWLQLAFLEIGGEKAATYLNFDYAGHIWVYNSGLNFGFREFSPGWVLLGNLLQWANENKRLAFDFMRGDEDYKYRFGGVSRYIVRALIRRI
jgi:CelD/BcsL family acetyltransferase involved in cellulose biosynthesis